MRSKIMLVKLKFGLELSEKKGGSFFMGETGFEPVYLDYGLDRTLETRALHNIVGTMLSQ